MPLDPTGGALTAIPEMIGMGAATGGASIPWTLILPTLASLVGELFGGGEEKQKEKDIAKLEQYMSGMYMPSRANVGGMNRVLTQAILNNVGRYTDWGWPGAGAGSGDLAKSIQQYLQGGAAGANIDFRGIFGG